MILVGNHSHCFFLSHSGLFAFVVVVRCIFLYSFSDITGSALIAFSGFSPFLSFFVSSLSLSLFVCLSSFCHYVSFFLLSFLFFFFPSVCHSLSFSIVSWSIQSFLSLSRLDGCCTSPLGSGFNPLPRTRPSLTMVSFSWTSLPHYHHLPPLSPSSPIITVFDHV